MGFKMLDYMATRLYRSLVNCLNHFPVQKTVQKTIVVQLPVQNVSPYMTYIPTVLNDSP